ncbi:MAG: adenylate/guanylate cyclase domain-containing protein [Candidatus Odinarchaeota archaeon]
MNINHYEKIVLSQFLQKRKEHPEESGRKVPIDTNQLATGGIKVVDAAVMVFDIAGSKKALEDLGNKKYIEWIGMALHLFFHCVDDYQGVIDKYTGDGAMVSFSKGNSNERCSNALDCACKISEILKKILNPLYYKKQFIPMKLRIGIDFGTIRIEKVGKKGKSHLIIIGGAANYSKLLEDEGRKLKFSQNTTICFGYDVLYNLSKKDVTGSHGAQLYRDIGHFSGNSEIDGSSPYKIYEYTGRFIN